MGIFSNFNTDEDYLSFIRWSLKEYDDSEIKKPEFFIYLITILNSIQYESDYFHNTIKKINNRIKDLIGDCNNLKDNHIGIYKYLTEFLFPRHTNYHEKTKDMVNIGIRRNPARSHYEFYIFKSDGTIDDISANGNCVYKIKLNDLHETMMKTIRFDERCDYSKERSSISIEIEIFLRMYTSRIPTSFDDDLYWGGTTFKESDSNFKDAWMNYYFNICSNQEILSG
jgi:hypothetical protein